MNFGYIPPVRKSTDRIFGASTTPMDNFLDGNWSPYLPNDELQAKNNIESDNCTGYGTSHVLETYLRRKYGEENDFSERAVGILAGTRPPGNDPVTVAQSWRDKGVIKESSLPFDDMVKSVDDYYSPSPLTASMLVEAQTWHEQYDVQYEYVFTNEHTPEEKRARLKECLLHSPLGIAVYAWIQDEHGLYYRPEGAPDTHWTMLYNIEDDGTYDVFDSYDNTHKRLRANYDFNFALRYYVQRKQNSIIPPKKSVFENFRRILTVPKFSC